MTVNECYTKTVLVGGDCLPPSRAVFLPALTRAVHAVARLFPDCTEEIPGFTEDGGEREIPLPPDGAELLPLRVAAEVFYYEDAALADRCLSLYLADAESLFRKRKTVAAAVIQTNGW